MDVSQPKQDISGSVCVFAKTPVLGTVKTRLQNHLGEQGCLELHKALINQRLSSLKPLNTCTNIDIELHVTDNTQHEFWLQASEEFSLPVFLQEGAELGERMYNAASKILEKKDWVILVGSDCPDLHAEAIEKAISDLESGVEVVIAPAEDGGYVLLGLGFGLSRLAKELFFGIDWGTEHVFQQTLDAVHDCSLSYSLLPTFCDLDLIDDFHYYREKYPEFCHIAL